MAKERRAATIEQICRNEHARRVKFVTFHIEPYLYGVRINAEAL